MYATIDDEIVHLANRKAAVEARDVLNQRERHLIELGAPPLLAAHVAKRPVDVHDIANLVERGCPIEIAVRLAPDVDQRPRLTARMKRKGAVGWSV